MYMTYMVPLGSYHDSQEGEDDPYTQTVVSVKDDHPKERHDPD